MGRLLAQTGASLGRSDRGKVPDRIHKLLSYFQRPVEALFLFLERQNKNFPWFSVSARTLGNVPHSCSQSGAAWQPVAETNR